MTDTPPAAEADILILHTPDLRLAISAEEAEERIERITNAVAEIWDDIIELYRGRAWIALGYETWEHLCDARLGIRPRLPKSERVPIVAQMTEAGMPTRAIGAALGMTNATASRDAAATVTNVTVGPREVIGQDGKTRTYVDPGARERLITLCRQIDSLSAHLMSDDRRAALDEMPFTIMHRMERPITAERIAECRRVLDIIEGKLQ